MIILHPNLKINTQCHSIGLNFFVTKKFNFLKCVMRNPGTISAGLPGTFLKRFREESFEDSFEDFLKKIPNKISRFSEGILLRISEGTSVGISIETPV